MLEASLKSKIDLLWDKFWSGGISNPLQAIEQMSYLIFMKRLEYEEAERERNARLVSGNYRSAFAGNPSCKWSKWTEMPADKMYQHVRDVVFPFLRGLNDETESVYSRYMKDSSFTIPTPSLLVEAVNIINGMHIKEQNRDAQGDLYEYLLSQLQTAGKNGQFRTPRHIIKMMTEILEPRYGDRICDPACGTAGFLIAAYEHILRANTSTELVREGNLAGDKMSTTQWKVLREQSLFGFDFDQTMVRISLMNLMMHGITNPNVDQKNTLSRRYNEVSRYDVIMANPPFKGSIDESEVGENFRTKTKKTELLFLELMYNLLTMGGRCSVIVPDGVLFGTSKAHKKIKDLLLKQCRLDAIVSMPSGVFKPYAGVSTAVLYFTKGEPTREVWFYEMENDGFSLDDKRTRIEADDIPEIVQKFRNRFKERPQDRKKKYFFVPIKEIEDNDFDLSISKYREIEYKEVEYEKPETIKRKVLDLERQILKELEEIDVS